MEKVKLLGAQCTLRFGRYTNNTIAIQAYNSEGELWCVPTVNYEKFFEGFNYKKSFKFPAVVIKNYSENEGIYDQLIKEGVILQGLYLSGSGGTVQCAVLTEKWQEIARKQLKIKSRK